jgi:hypothetical protein
LERSFFNRGTDPKDLEIASIFSGDGTNYIEDAKENSNYNIVHGLYTHDRRLK